MCLAVPPTPKNDQMRLQGVSGACLSLLLCWSCMRAGSIGPCDERQAQGPTDRVGMRTFQARILELPCFVALHLALRASAEGPQQRLHVMPLGLLETCNDLCFRLENAPTLLTSSKIPTLISTNYELHFHMRHGHYCLYKT